MERTPLTKLAETLLQQAHIDHPLIRVYRRRVLAGTETGLLPAWETITAEEWATLAYYEGCGSLPVEEFAADGYGSEWSAYWHRFQPVYPAGYFDSAKILDAAALQLCCALLRPQDQDNLANGIAVFHRHVLEGFLWRSWSDTLKS